MYKNIFSGYFLSEVMYHERDRNTLELKKDKQNARYSLNKLLKHSPQENKNKKSFFSGNSLTGKVLTDANKCYFWFHTYAQ